MIVRIERLLLNHSGGASLELALVLPIYLLIILGIFAVGFLLWTENSIQFAAQAAARCASVNSTSCGTVSAVQNAAIGWSSGILSSSEASLVTVKLGATCSSGITGNAVKIEYPLTLLVITTTVAVEACYPAI